MRCVPSRKSITSIESKDHEKLVLAGARPLTKQATLMSLGKRGSGDKLREVVSNNFYIVFTIIGEVLCLHPNV